MQEDCVMSQSVSARKCLLRLKSCDIERRLSFSDIMAVFDENWENTLASITERGIFMFNNELLSDVSLVVRSGSEDDPKMAIPAHKMVLSICSPVFFAMFCGKMAEKSDSVDLPDCEYEGVMEMLRYMYSEKTELNESNVMQVLYVAKKYMVKSLAEECLTFLEDNLNAGNVFCVLSSARQYDETDLEAHCWEVIDRHTYGVVQSTGFAIIERCLLEEIVTRDSLTIREIELFKAVDLWAAEECKRKGLSVNGNEKRRVLGENIVHGIRFPTMEEKEFASVVINSEILTSAEVVGLIKYFNSATLTADFPEKERVGALLSCCRFYGLDQDRFCFYGDLKRHCIDLRVDKDIILHGIRMIGSENNDYVAMLNITDTRQKAHPVIASKSGIFPSVFIRDNYNLVDYHGFNIWFDSPIVLVKGVKYRVTAIIDGPKSVRPIPFLDSVISHGVEFDFTRKEASSDFGGEQFAQFLFQQK